MSSPLVLVVGGTRGTGLLAARLLRDRQARVRVLARQPAAARVVLGANVDVVAGDLTNAATLPPALRDVHHVLFTAGIRSGRFATDARVKATDYLGVVNLLTASRDATLPGRFVYMTSIGGVTPSVPATLLNFVKGNVLAWRRRAEDAIRQSGVDYTIVRAGFLLNAASGRRAIDVSQGDLPLLLRYRIARADVAEACVAALQHPRASRATFEIVWGRGSPRDWHSLLGGLRPDPPDR